MGYGYSSRRYSYDSPVPSDLDSENVETLVSVLKTSIEEGKLKDLKSALSKLKLAINNEYPLYTGDTATLSAFVYAHKVGNKKSIDSLTKVLVKKNYEFDGFPLLDLVENMPSSDFKILVDEYLLVKTYKFNVDDDLKALDSMFRKYPKETEKIIYNGKLSKYLKGDFRLAAAVLILSKAKEITTLLLALMTYFGTDYVDKFGVQENKLYAMRDALNNQSSTNLKQILKDFFYVIYIKDIPTDMFVSDANKGLMDKEAVINYTKLLYKKQPNIFLNNLMEIEDTVLRSEMATADKDITDFIVANKPEILPDSVTDIFLF